MTDPTSIAIHPALVQDRDLEQEKLLDVVEKEVSGRINQSLYFVLDEMLIHSRKKLQPEHVQFPWNREISIRQQASVQLSAETTILQVFEHPAVNQKLLLLGEPGAGKTTTLLSLARHLVVRAKQDINRPIPVLLDLSSWKGPKQPVRDWLATELRAKYGLQKKLAKDWLSKNQLLPLLDGLDELEPVHQEECATALNRLLTDDAEQRPVGIVICCRCKEYQEVVKERLSLDGVILLQPLNEEQIGQYFDQFNLITVWQTSCTSESLKQLLSKPPLLAIFGLVAAGGKFDAHVWQQKATELDQQEYLLDQYWEMMVTRELIDKRAKSKGFLSKTYGKKALPPRQEVRRSLVFIAKALENESETEFLIEKMQPCWLSKSSQRWQYRIIFGLCYGFFFGLATGLIGGLIAALTTSLIAEAGVEAFLVVFVILALFAGIHGGIIGVWIVGLKISPVEAIQFSLPRPTQTGSALNLLLLIPKTVISIIFGVFFGVFFGVYGGGIYGTIFGVFFVLLILAVEPSYPISMEFFAWTLAGVVLGPIFVIAFGIAGMLIGGLKADIKARTKPNQGIKNSRNNMLVLGAIGILSILPLKFILEVLLNRLLGRFTDIVITIFVIAQLG